MMTRSLLVPFGASANSFHMNTPHKIATTGAALLSAYDIAGPAAPAAIKETTIPNIQMVPPNTPTIWVLKLPFQYSDIFTGSPCTGFLIKIGLKMKVLTNTPTAKKNIAENGGI